MTHLPSFLLSKELSTQLQLKEQHFLVLIPKKLVSNNELSFEFTLKNNRLSLLSSKIVPEVNQSEVIDT
ncbi:hypothetical protein [Nitrosopumilus sp. S6]